MPRLNFSQNVPAPLPGVQPAGTPSLAFPPAVSEPQNASPEAVADQLQMPARGSAAASLSLGEPVPNMTYTVKPGDSLGKIAKALLGDFNRYPEIYALNQNKLMNPNDLRIGMQLELPIPDPAARQTPPQAAAPAAETVVPADTPAAEPRFTEHTVRPGDSLSTIARQHLGASNRYREIFEANRDQLQNPNNLSVGMTLKIPVDETQAAAPAPPPAEAATPAPAADSQTDASAEQQWMEYTVKRNDALSSIALDYLGDASRYMEIFEANRDQLRDPGAIRPGMTLRIPLSEAGAAQLAEEAAAVTTTGAVGVDDLNARARELYDALKGYQAHHNRLGNTNRTRTTESEMIEIAHELERAATAFNVDPKLMLAVFAHESGGFNPRARSHTGAGGLGQLTGIAIRQVHTMAGMVRGQRGQAPHNQYSENFVASTNRISDRYPIKQNVWTSTAYMAYELQGRAHLGRGVENAVSRYGDPNVSTYSDKVNDEYRTLFGSRLW
ncbi:MAG: LysM peptidoglycan-binding domain-containing protein [Candidatus Sericytochromatia bacterium]|nr:LysM peptidoglycan-binding domain-containing protein [Candidatus Sericytochromatia bacterium]